MIHKIIHKTIHKTIHESGHTCCTLNKLKETKLKKEKNKKKFIPPTLNEVENYVADKKLTVNAKQFYNYFTEGNWVDSNGNQVKNWKQKLLTWNGYSSNKTAKNTSKTSFKGREYTSEELKSLYSNNEWEG